MEITYPNLLNYIRVYDDVLDKQVLQTFLKICEENPNFNEAGITRSKEEPNFVNKQIRDVKSWGLVNIGEEMFFGLIIFILNLWNLYKDTIKKLEIHFLIFL